MFWAGSPRNKQNLEDLPAAKPTDIFRWRD
jgi:hypothetical protein